MFSYNYKNKKHKGLCSFVLLCLLFVAAGAVAQTQQYALNDPRNPDCPCHKAQKQAEQEYAQLNLPKEKVVINQETDPLLPQKNKETAAQNTTVVRQGNTSVSGKNKRKNKIALIRKFTFRYIRKHRGIKKMHTDYSVCFHNW